MCTYYIIPTLNLYVYPLKSHLPKPGTGIVPNPNGMVGDEMLDVMLG